MISPIHNALYLSNKPYWSIDPIVLIRIISTGSREDGPQYRTVLFQENDALGAVKREIITKHHIHANFAVLVGRYRK